MKSSSVVHIRKLLASADRRESRNDLEAAARLYKESQQLLQTQGRDPKVAALRVRSICGIACIRRHQGHFKTSEQMYRRALQIAEEAFGPEHQVVSNVLNDLGVLLKYAGRFTEAGQLYQRALANSEKHLGANHPDVATVYHNLSGLEHAAGNFVRAESFGRYALKLRQKIVGAAHPDCALEMAALAPILDGRRKF